MAVDKLPLQITGTLGFYNRLWWRLQRRQKIYADWNYEQNAIFVHIPKTAGTSIFRAIRAEPVGDTHAWAVSYRDHDPVFWRQAFTFAFVRNPWDRFCSCFHFMKSGTDWPMQQEWAVKHIADMSFEDFTLETERNFLFRSAIKAERFFWPQKLWVVNGANDLIVRKYYKFEFLERSIADICARLNIAAPQTLPHERRVNRKDYRDLYSSQMVDSVGKLYRSDIEFFDYAFEN